MLDIEYLDSDTKGKAIKLREFITTDHYRKLLDNYGNKKLLFSYAFMRNILKYEIDDILDIFKRLNRAANLLSNEILILYTENSCLKLSFYIHNYSYGSEKVKEMIKKYFSATVIEFNDLNVEQDKYIIIEDIDVLKGFLEI